MREFFEMINEYPFISSACIACYGGMIIGMVADAIKYRKKK